jgi:hypothetical protein
MSNKLNTVQRPIKWMFLASSIALASGLVAMMANSASASILSFQVNQNPTNDTSIFYDVTIKDIVGGVQVGVTQSATSPNSGDLLGLFFNVQPGNASNYGITGLSNFTNIAGDVISNVCFNTTNCGNGNNVNGGPVNSFDIGLTFGSQGTAGGVLVKSNTFSIASSTLTTANFLNQSFAVRAQTSGIDPTTGGGGSTKEFGVAPSQAVPEPLTILGALTAAGFGAAFKRRTTKTED